MKKLIPYLLAIVPLVLLYVICCRGGNLTSPDSEYYLHIASNLFHKHLYYGPGGKPIIYWPPLYALILVPKALIENYVYVLQLVLLIVHQILWIKILKRCFKENKFITLTAAILGLNTLIFTCAIYIWSEMLFMVLMTWTFLSTINFMQTANRRNLIELSAALFLALLTRNAGVFFIPGFLVFGMIYLDKNLRIPFSVAVLVGASGNLLWNFQRLFLMKHLHAFEELFPVFTPGRNFLFTVEELYANLLPRFMLNFSWLLVFISLIFITGILIRYKLSSKEEAFITLIFISYLVFWFIIPAEKDNLGRFLAPVFPLFLIVLQTHLSSTLRMKFAKQIFLLVNAYLIVFSLARIITNVNNWSSLI